MQKTRNDEDDVDEGVDKNEEGAEDAEEEQAQNNALCTPVADTEETVRSPTEKPNKGGDRFKECIEGESTSNRQRVWTLSSRTDVGAVLTEYMKAIPNAQKSLNPAYCNVSDLTGDDPEIKCLFSAADWAEMVTSFEQEIKLEESEVPDGLLHLFDELEKAGFPLTDVNIAIIKAKEDIITIIEQISPKAIEKAYGVSLNAKDQEEFAAL
ncbi:hypothetical protein BC938DRAFT_471271 [Jimgerdemannia flammicorona]|uniref:Uncharacterized protein n=1 Tax=Jimgerdemannia flammicorona TaxID=994334 RepID=A0A433Q8G0_9FUNG|nr:hypothetical protein BC938DRAFT_471271 [Jimgerdemannia flammicorona]